jgi:hypothetical protein
MPSSTSNSNVYYRDIPDRPWNKIVWFALVLLILGIASWEMLARKMHHTPGTYQGLGYMWTEERQKLDQANHDVRVVLAGSSRILWAADLDILEQGLGSRPIQMALPGTSPALIVEDIVNNTDYDGLIIVGATPFLFNRLDGGFMGGVVMDLYENMSPSKWSGDQLHRFLSDYFAFLDNAFDLFGLLERYTNFEDRPDAKDLKSGDWKLGNMYDDIQTDMWAPVEQEGSFDNQQILNFWNPGLDKEPKTAEEMAELAEKTLEFFAPLVAKLQARGGDMIFIRMPSRGRYLERDIETNHRQLLWEPMAKGFGATAFNTFDYPELSTELEIPEWSHLSRKSQDDWSRDVVPIMAEQYQAYRGVSLFDLIKGKAKTGDD